MIVTVYFINRRLGSPAPMATVAAVAIAKSGGSDWGPPPSRTRSATETIVVGKKRNLEKKRTSINNLEIQNGEIISDSIVDLRY